MKIAELEHLVIAMTIQAICGFFTGDFILGGVFASAFFFGREHAQAEERWIGRHGGKREGMPYFAGFYLSVWDVHSWFWNLTLPIIGNILLWGMMK